MAAPIAGPDLSDPLTCGEDETELARRMVEIAPRLCGDCRDYHVMRSLRRAALGTFGGRLDRGRLIEMVAGLAGDRNGALDILIAGAADSGNLASCAHAVLRAGALERTRFTVLDRCRTPLELCREFAQRFGITLAVEAVDLVTTTRTFAADIVVHDSLFKFIAPASRVDAMKRLAGWLKPDGRLVFLTSVHPAEAADRNARAKAEAGAAAIEQARDMVLVNLESAQLLRARLDRDLAGNRKRQDSNFSAEQTADLLVAAGLRVVALRRFADEIPTQSGLRYSRDRMVVVAARADCAAPVGAL